MLFKGRRSGRQYFVAALRARFGGRLRTIARLADLGRYLAGIQKRILLDLVGNEGFQFEIGQGQQLDRLLQLRRHNQLLAEFKLLSDL